jgi:multicomponent Na+:H+ antiporter subunit D
MPLTCLCGIVGALSISAFPLTSGFVSKSMISQGAAELDLAVVWYLLTAASAGVFLHAGIKFPWFVFFHRDSGLRPPEPPWNMKLAMVLLSGISIGLGIVPGVLYGLLPFPARFESYTASHVLLQLQLLLFSGLAFFMMLGALRRTLTITLDVDWLWRRLGPALLKALDSWSSNLWDACMHAAGRGVEGAMRGARRLHGPDGVLARTWPTGNMAFWTAAILAAFLVLSYI